MQTGLDIIPSCRKKSGCMPSRPDEPNQNITMSYINNKGLWGFVGGMIAAAIGAKVVKSPVSRKLAVQGLSKAMHIQRKATEKPANIREKAQNLYHEAADTKRWLLSSILLPPCLPDAGRFPRLPARKRAFWPCWLWIRRPICPRPLRSA